MVATFKRNLLKCIWIQLYIYRVVYVYLFRSFHNRAFFYIWEYIHCSGHKLYKLARSLNFVMVVMIVYCFYIIQFFYHRWIRIAIVCNELFSRLHLQGCTISHHYTFARLKYEHNLIAVMRIRAWFPETFSHFEFNSWWINVVLNINIDRV